MLSYFTWLYHLSHEQAARIIGDHFADVKDGNYTISSSSNLSLLIAKQVQLIEGRTTKKCTDTNPVPFQNAIDLEQNKKHLRFALDAPLLLLALLVGAPSLIKESSAESSITTKSLKAAPFHFKI
ncbi:MAG: hypothetical protein IPO69_16045 [Saprospiraceae bacterium]|nr:hypothetical protein [Saprospiraceae bacterium]